MGTAGEHVYLSTSCYHGQHEYCQSSTGKAANGPVVGQGTILLQVLRRSVHLSVPSGLKSVTCGNKISQKILGKLRKRSWF